MGSRDLTAGVETPGEVFDTAVEISEDILDKMVANIKLALLILVIAVSYSSGSPAHHRLRRAPQEQATRLFTGNSAIDAGAAGAALGAANPARKPRAPFCIVSPLTKRVLVLELDPLVPPLQGLRICLPMNWAAAPSAAPAAPASIALLPVNNLVACSWGALLSLWCAGEL